MDVDPDHREPSNGPKPHDFLWFPDGNVVLSTDTFLFKVHKSLLAVHSSVFRDMFELPNVGHGSSNPEGSGGSDFGSASELYEGVPMVTLAGDKGEDVVHLLRAVFERDYYHRDDDNTSLEVIVALVVLSTKYDFNAVRKDVILHISRQYPMCLHEYEALDDDEAPLFGKTRANCHFPLLVAAVTADADVLLPCLFFACSDYAIDYTFHKAQSLPRKALQTLIQGRDSWNLEVNIYVCSIPERLQQLSVEGGCQLVRSCLEDARFLDLHGHIQPNFRDFTGKNITKSCLRFDMVCSTCHSFAERKINEERRRIWDALPSYFKFPEWSVLRAQLRAIVES
ncbi:hypothetical protein SCHPADRAFT_610352 [Schizopora paradoxa]|uniref:BTB domain-containing protein n=1 Tax=Schizopora paradoxa TaxID=27342 RepID=A0A0H2R943_9AGAM|nr:hypothetical protein SCHPADRAFT_610352 [Schizopora paradoxa]